MGEALYRKYRPQSLRDVVGQPHITKTLDNALKDGKISHAYLFTGPRGVGKTSIARILAHEVNGFTYADASGALDIIEIDAASNRRIDEIRELRDKVHMAPVQGKYKVYIIDEVHMLTREAFNALLKTLEEPPAHVIFILATTEVHKLPETIVSRTQRFTFKSVSQKEVAAHLKHLAKKEGITISDEALLLIATHGEGSFRDSISLLDQLSIAGKVGEEEVRQLLGVPPEATIDQLIDSISQGDIKAVVETLETASAHGYSSTHIGRELANRLRSGLIANQELLGDSTMPTLEKLLQVPAMPQPGQYLELVLVGTALGSTNRTKIDLPSPKPQTVSSEVKTKDQPKPQKKAKAAEPEAKKIDTPAPKATKHSTIKASELEEQLKDGLWEKTLTIIKKKYNTLYGVARMGTVSVDENILVLTVTFPFHQKRLSEPKNAEIILHTLEDVAGSSIGFRCEIITKKDNSKKSSEDTSATGEKPDTLQAVNDIFGGGEVLDS